MGRQQDGLVVAFKVMARIVPFKIYLLRQVQGSAWGYCLGVLVQWFPQTGALINGNDHADASRKRSRRIPWQPAVGDLRQGTPKC